MTRLVALLALALLPAACGADGAPSPPSKDAPRTGITISGEARMGVTAKL